MRSLAFVLVTPLLACSVPAKHADQLTPDGQNEPDGGGGPLPPPTNGFQLVSPTVSIAPGEESTYCYYFHTSNADAVAIQRWVSHMTPGVHEMILYLTPTDVQPPDTMSSTNCGFARTNGSPRWTYSTQSPDAQWVLPSDDGAGNPIGQQVGGSQPGFLQIHYLNTTGSTVHAHVELNAYAYDRSISPTLAGPFATFGSMIQIGPGSTAQPTTGQVSGTCPVPLDQSGQRVRFFMMTTHTYRQGVHTSISDGTTTLFNSTSWLQPGDATFSPFYAFKGDSLTYQCEYQNSNAYTIMTGDNPTTDELCMSISFYIPADPDPLKTGHYCRDSATFY